MRVENTKVTFTIPIPISRPDCNGVVYTKEAIEDAINNFRANTPILYKDNDIAARVVGTTTCDHPIVAWDSENQICNMNIDGVVFHCGAEMVVNEIKDNIISSFEIRSIGVTT